jgi:hypothetical protein
MFSFAKRYRVFQGEVAARFINQRCPWMNVVAIMENQDRQMSFYASFNVIISGWTILETPSIAHCLRKEAARLNGDEPVTTVVPYY